VDGVMLGRAAYHNPWILVECQQYPETDRQPQRTDIIRRMQDYCLRQTAQGVPIKHISRHMLGLFQGLPGARSWRRWISENAHMKDTDHQLLSRALQHYLTVQPEQDAA